jgi:phosphoglucosamine mutase
LAKQLFGTDGIRGVAGEYPLDRATVYAFGIALADDALRNHGGSENGPRILIGADTRESGPWIAETVAGGLASRGVPADYAGIITTPGVAYLTRTGPYCAGVMISASHNPFEDNGIKVFSHSGFKLPDSEEHEIETEILKLLEAGVKPQPVGLTADDSLDGRYLDFLLSTVSTRFDGMRIVVDCGNGAACRPAPELFKRLGADVVMLNAAPNGRNINLNCGALHVESLRDAVLANGAGFGTWVWSARLVPAESA